MKLTLGPVLYEWKRDELFRFYDEAAEMPVDTVYIGEVVCSKKIGLKPADIEKVGKKLEAAGKKVVASTLAIVSNEDELKLTREMAALPFPVEANDMSVMNIAADSGKEIHAGAHITSYNVPSIEFLKSVGVKRFTFPVELPKSSIEHNIKNTGVFAEVFAHGRLPLAFSWRCYTSRAYGLTKTNCRHHCGQHPEGMELRTVKGEPLFAANGTSILSAKTHTLIEFIDDLASIGVRALRISPQQKNTSRIAEVFRNRIDNKINCEEALAELKLISPTGLCNGWYAGSAGKDYTALANA